MRAVTSTLPPAVNGTISVMGLAAGQAGWAWAAGAASAAKAMAAVAARAWCFVGCLSEKRWIQACWPAPA